VLAALCQLVAGAKKIKKVLNGIAAAKTPFAENDLKSNIQVSVCWRQGNVSCVSFMTAISGSWAITLW
jgi:hypothetical protein